MVFSTVFRYNVGHSDVISGVAVVHVGVDVLVKVGDSWPNGSRDIRGADFMSNERTNEHVSGICAND